MAIKKGYDVRADSIAALAWQGRSSLQDGSEKKKRVEESKRGDSVDTQVHSPANHDSILRSSAFRHGENFSTVAGYTRPCRRLVPVVGSIMMSVDFRIGPKFRPFSQMQASRSCSLACSCVSAHVDVHLINTYAPPSILVTELVNSGIVRCSPRCKRDPEEFLASFFRMDGDKMKMHAAQLKGSFWREAKVVLWY